MMASDLYFDGAAPAFWCGNVCHCYTGPLGEYIEHWTTMSADDSLKWLKRYRRGVKYVTTRTAETPVVI